MDSVMRLSSRPVSALRQTCVRSYMRSLQSPAPGILELPTGCRIAPFSRLLDGKINLSQHASDAADPAQNRLSAFNSATQAAASSFVADSKTLSDMPPEEDATWQVKMLYDGECPLCMIEVNALKDRNKSYGTIKFVDISSPDFSPEENAGVEFEAAMGKIHCIQRDGAILTGVAAFQKFYDVLGMGWVYTLTKIKPIGALADGLYEFWSKYRLPITGRPPLAIVLEERKKLKEAADTCDVNGRCNVDF